MRHHRLIVAGVALTISSVFGGMAVQAGQDLFATVDAATSCGGGLTAGECAAEQSESTTWNGQPVIRPNVNY